MFNFDFVKSTVGLLQLKWMGQNLQMLKLTFSPQNINNMSYDFRERTWLLTASV